MHIQTLVKFYQFVLKILSGNETRASSRWGAIANPHAKVFDSLSTLQSHPGALPWQQNENSVQYVFYILFMRTHTKFGIKIFEIDILMIFDLLTSPQGHQFDPRMKKVTCILFCSSSPSIWYVTWPCLKKKQPVWPSGYTPSAQKSHLWGMTQAT